MAFATLCGFPVPVFGILSCRLNSQTLHSSAVSFVCADTATTLCGLNVHNLKFYFCFFLEHSMIDEQVLG